MKAIAYNIQPYEKELLTLANGKRHELTLISNELNDKTVLFAQGKEVVIVISATVLSAAMMRMLTCGGVRKVIVRAVASPAQEVFDEADLAGIQVVTTPVAVDSPAHIAEKAIEYLDRWESEKTASLRGDQQAFEKEVRPTGRSSAEQYKRYNP